ncbi:MAG: hypothetical protein ACKO37_10040 [Vampirovibrionales bacterium]
MLRGIQQRIQPHINGLHVPKLRLTPQDIQIPEARHVLGMVFGSKQLSAPLNHQLLRHLNTTPTWEFKPSTEAKILKRLSWKTPQGTSEPRPAMVIEGVPYGEHTLKTFGKKQKVQVDTASSKIAHKKLLGNVAKKIDPDLSLQQHVNHEGKWDKKKVEDWHTDFAGVQAIEHAPVQGQLTDKDVLEVAIKTPWSPKQPWEKIKPGNSETREAYIQYRFPVKRKPDRHVITVLQDSFTTDVASYHNEPNTWHRGIEATTAERNLQTLVYRFKPKPTYYTLEEFFDLASKLTRG